MRKKKRILIIIILISAIIGGFVFFVVSKQKEKAKEEAKIEEKFWEEYLDIVEDIKSMNKNCDYIINVLSVLWRECDDNNMFLEEYTLLMSNKSPEFLAYQNNGKITGVIGVEWDIAYAVTDNNKSNVDRVSEAMKIIENFRSSYQKAYNIDKRLKDRVKLIKDLARDIHKDEIDLLEELYVESSKYADLALEDISDSYNSYISKANEYAEVNGKLYERIELYLPE